MCIASLGGGLYERNRYRRRPGTVAVAAAIHNKYDITVVPHILCSGFSREDTEYILLDLQFLGITNLLVLRGDKAKNESFFCFCLTKEVVMPMLWSWKSRSMLLMKANLLMERRFRLL